jgi:hypothetical protein
LEVARPKILPRLLEDIVDSKIVAFLLLVFPEHDTGVLLCLNRKVLLVFLIIPVLALLVDLELDESAFLFLANHVHGVLLLQLGED